MTATIDAPPLQQGATAPPPDQLTKALYGDAGQYDPSTQRYSSTGEALIGKMTHLVKGAGFAGEGGNTPLTNQGDIGRRAAEAAISLRIATREGVYAKSQVTKSLSQGFLNQFGALRLALESPSPQEYLAMANPDLVRSFTAGNLGIGSTYGLVPFNLLAPSRLVYPVGD